MFQKEEIESQKEEIRAQRDILQRTNNTIEKQKSVLELQNKNIIASIRYAQRIQHALMSDLEQIRTIWPETFVFIQPKDIVSGDFYYIDTLRVDGTPKHVFAAIDCTGHGVPGALMSILSYNSLKQTVKELRHTNPLYIVTYLNRYIYEALHNNRHHPLNDGLDIAYVVFDPAKNELEYLGVQMPLYIVRNQQLLEFKPNRFMLGC